ncbi:unnamed protein product [Cuscuta epithymum]|uniref:ASCH domain-containing protein n=2 Tax=Cuscuta epithymum TaxID=186058 RepID=A0AAV0EIT7_9ASTE|nr:unnamed protein product [Cuscuta epithymum]
MICSFSYLDFIYTVSVFVFIMQMLETADFELHVQEPFFTYLKSGDKTIEGRCATDQYKKIEVGASILFNKCLLLQVQDLHYYASFREMLEAEPLCKVLPEVETTEEGVQVYRNFYSEEKEMSNGVLAICVKKPMWQPYLSMASIISDLSLGGLQSLLDVAHRSEQC